MVENWSATAQTNGLALVRDLLRLVGDDPEREGLRDTPKRVVRSWNLLYSGYRTNPSDVLKTDFSTDNYSQMILLKDIDFYSTCEHHILPFFGKAHVAYIPGERIVGISKLARVVEIFARRLQIQERMTEQIADAIEENVKPKGVMVIIEAQHICMTSRGVQKQNAVMTTSAIRGNFKDDVVRQEFLDLIGKKR